MQSKATKVEYTKASGEVSERVIIPTFVPSKNVKALDVTTLSESDQKELEALLAQYAEYYELMQSRIYSFGDWLEQTSPATDKSLLKWRTFKLDNLVEK